MSPIERFIARHKAARYVFVLAGFPCIAVSDRLRGNWNPAGFDDLRRALKWARNGGDPAQAIQRPDPAPLSPKWQERVDQACTDSATPPSDGGVR